MNVKRRAQRRGAVADVFELAAPQAAAGSRFSDPFTLSALILDSALYAARLVPRWLSVWGLGGAALDMAAGAMVMFGLEPRSTTQVVLDASLAVQEMMLAIWLIIKGFSTPAGLAAPDAEAVAVRA